MGSTVQALLHGLVRGKPCRVHSSDQRVRIGSSGRAYYPDASVTCGPIQTDPDDPDAIIDAVLVVEVLSPSTERYDSIFKLADYRTMPGMRAVMFIRSDRVEVQRWRKDDAGEWGMTVHGRGQRIPLPGLDAWLLVDELYADVGMLPAPG
ncbi:MAG: Uma2 family endonuclease [Oligoflexia bacterium]|nr:Uma2 family endonuclease [Oligoflexia bacterium]